MKTILLAFSVAEAMTADNLVSIVKNQVGFEIKNEDFDVKAIEMTDLDNISSEELSLLIGEPTPSEAIFAFIASAANSKESISLSKRKDPAPALAIATALIAANNWDEPRESWEKNIEFPALNEDLDQRKKEFTSVLFKKKPEAPVLDQAPVVSPAPTPENTTTTQVSEGTTNELPLSGVELLAPVATEVIAPSENASADEPGEGDKKDEEEDPFKGSE